MGLKVDTQITTDLMRKAAEDSQRAIATTIQLAGMTGGQVSQALVVNAAAEVMTAAIAFLAIAGNDPTKSEKDITREAMLFAALTVANGFKMKPGEAHPFVTAHRQFEKITGRPFTEARGAFSHAFCMSPAAERAMKAAQEEAAAIIAARGRG